MVVTVIVAVPGSAGDKAKTRGADIYNYFCYQCHGYAGNARTLASTFLEPPPRDFSRASLDSLSRESMLDAVTRGRPGTAMAGFARVLTAAEIEQVVDFVRREFMASGPSDGRYHTAANGWPDHQRYAAAFPFATGTVALDTPWEQLSADQQAGRRLYFSACITCHDRGETQQSGPIWSLRAVSFPRKHYSHRTDEYDGLTGASPYVVHERPPEFVELSQAQARGRSLYLHNCAFCHAPDGSGRNWIGSFLEPRPAELTGLRVASMDDRLLRTIIQDGLPGTSMPAWKQVLGQRQIEDIIAYLKRASAELDKTRPVVERAAPDRGAASLRWQRRPTPTGSR